MSFMQGNVRLVSRALLLFALIAGLSLVADANAKGRERKAGKRSAATKNRNGSKTISRSNSRSIAKSNPRQRERGAQSTLTKRQRLAELRRATARRRAEVARLAAIARENARNEALRNAVQAMIAKDDLKGEDLEVRRVAVNALGNHAGTVVVMNPQTGRVYSIVNQNWALHEGFKPCSTIKLVTGLAGLNENVIDPTDTTKISDRNEVSLTKALAYSKNDYFQQVGGQVGFDKMVEYARQLGLGEKTGINVRGEFAGRMPSATSRSGVYRMSSHGDSFQVTPLQLATLVSAMANGGKLVTPFVPRSTPDAPSSKTKVRRTIDLNPDAWKQMVPGMVGAVNYGSGRKAYDPNQTIAGKTGTCIEQGGWVGLFTSYAPLANPKLAVVVIARGADARSHFPAAVAGRIYRELSGRFGTTGTVQIAKARETFPIEAVETDDEESDAIATAQIHPTQRTTGVQPLVRSGATNSKVKAVIMPLPRQLEVQKPVVKEIVARPQSAELLTRPRRIVVDN